MEVNIHSKLYWILDIEGEVHCNMGFVDKATFKITRATLSGTRAGWAIFFWVGPGCPIKKLVGEGLQ